MSKVVAIMSMSLDGYVADANDGVAEVFDWYFSGDVEVSTASTTSGCPWPGCARIRPMWALHVAEPGRAPRDAGECGSPWPRP
jgi:hypothetical protein